MVKRLNRTHAGAYSQILLLVDGGVCRKTNLSTFSRYTWVRFNEYFDELIELGYLEFFDGSVVLTDLGRRMVAFIKANIGFFDKDLYSYFRYG